MMEDFKPAPGDAIIQSPDECGNTRWLCFRSPREIVQTARLSDIPALLDRIESATDEGYHAAGFITYEAAPAFDEAFRTHAPERLPLIWFGIYDDVISCDDIECGSMRPLDWQPSVDLDEYNRAIERIKDYIASGDTYQVNYTMRLEAPFGGNPWALFNALRQAQNGRYAAYIDTGDCAICSVSPELFFTLSGTEITCRPMKGTAARGLTSRDDTERSRDLYESAKDRAENLMIVDMMRNDLGRIAEPGSVRVPELFAVETYDTLFQMTSTVKAHTSAGFADILRALFPCASITGAPKVRTMEIIRELETAPRGIYTGCIGYASPGRKIQFNVAIRTVCVDKASQRAEYGVGGGIVWDSDPEQEHLECLTKARVLFEELPDFQLLETMLWKPGEGYFLLDKHLRRLTDSAQYFGFRLNICDVGEQLETASEQFGNSPQRVRLLAARDGSISVESAPFEEAPPVKTWKVALSRTPIDATNRFLYHKTTNRRVYRDARAGLEDYDDVILWNSRGEVTESAIANIIIRRGSELITPPVECGLLPGTYRSHLIEAAQVREGIITIRELEEADEVYLINSVRGWMRVELPVCTKTH